MAATWNDKYPIFNDSIIQESSGTLQFSTRRFIARKSESRLRTAMKEYWILDISGLLLSPEQYEEILALSMSSAGMLREILVRNMRFCTLESADDTPSLLGTGNSSRKVFQLTKTLTNQGRSHTFAIRHPNHNYPPLKDLNRKVWEPMKELQIWADGEEMTTGWSVDRNTGRVTFSSAPAAGVILEATGGFYSRMLAPDSIPVKPEGCNFRVDGTVQFIEPFEGVEAFLG